MAGEARLTAGGGDPPVDGDDSSPSGAGKKAVLESADESQPGCTGLEGLEGEGGVVGKSDASPESSGTQQPGAVVDSQAVCGDPQGKEKSEGHDGQQGRLEEGEEDDEEEEEQANVEWMLGFVEPVEDRTQLLRHRFPSKVGGRPAWLDPINIPTREQLTCGISSRPMEFLLQVYAPVEAVDQAFHRTLFVFITPEGSQVHQAGAVKVFRSQLARSNPFYPSEPLGEDVLAPPRLSAEAMEAVTCRDPWTSALAEIATSIGRTFSDARFKSLLPENEIVVEPEEAVLEEATPEKIETDVTRLMKAYEEKQKHGEELTDEELPREILDTVEDAASREKKQFAAFSARVAPAPDQVLRYCFDEGAAPIWPSANTVPKASDIPPCGACGAPRRFEFQILPQLLHFLDIDISQDLHKTLDWSTIAIFSCSNSCQPPAICAGYVEEFAWVQPA